MHRRPIDSGSKYIEKNVVVWIRRCEIGDVLAQLSGNKRMIMALLAELSLLIEDNLGSRAVRAYPFQSRCDTYASLGIAPFGGLDDESSGCNGCRERSAPCAGTGGKCRDASRAALHERPHTSHTI